MTRKRSSVIRKENSKSAMEPTPSCGHVFVLNCDSIGIAADAILIPIRDLNDDGDLHEEKMRVKPGTVNALSPAEIEAAGLIGVSRCFEGQISTRLYDTEEEAVSGTMMVVDAFLQAAGAALKGQKSGFKRAKPLLALPMPGVGKMDQSGLIDEMGSVLRPLLSRLYTAADDFGVDVALCTTDTGAFKVAHVLRETCCPWQGGPFWMLPAELQQEAQSLQAKASSGRLGLLFGAGVSFPSGLPSWGGLLQQLAARAGFSEEEQQQLLELGMLDQPTLIEERMGDATRFKEAVAECVKHGRYTPAHSILGSMELPAVTTNYDPLYEKAVDSAAASDIERVWRLPWDAAKIARMPSRVRRLLKLHGCVVDPRSIVLTRADYMRYEDGRRALRGVLHQNLLEREYLVVGFSMTDDNVHLIIDQVRKALAGLRDCHGEALGSFSMGTIVPLVESPMFRKLWEKDFRVVACASSWDDNPAWKHDIFLDKLASGLIVKRAAASFVLDSQYETLLTDSQRKVKEALAPLHALLHDRGVTESKSWPAIEALLKEFGAPECQQQQPVSAEDRYS